MINDQRSIINAQRSMLNAQWNDPIGVRMFCNMQYLMDCESNTLDKPTQNGFFRNRCTIRKNRQSYYCLCHTDHISTFFSRNRLVQVRDDQHQHANRMTWVFQSHTSNKPYRRQDSKAYTMDTSNQNTIHNRNKNSFLHWRLSLLQR